LDGAQERLAARIAAQEQIVAALAEAGSLQEAGARVLGTVGELLGWTLGMLWEVDERHGLLRLTADWSAPGLDRAEFVGVARDVSFQRGVGLQGRVWETAAAEWVPDLGADPAYLRARAARAAGLRTAVAAPVVGDRGIVGVIELFSPETRTPDLGTAEVLASVSSQVGLYVERRRADVRVEESERLHAATVAAALDCIVTMDATGHVVEFNPAAEATFGYSREEALGGELAELIVPPELRDAHRGAIARHLATGEARILGRRLELTGLRRDGSRFPLELTVVRLSDSDPPLFTGFVRDIEHRKRVEAEIERLLTAEQDARRAAEAAERESAQIALTLQQNLLPPGLPDIEGVDMAAYFLAAGAYQMGGDFYDVLRTGDGRWAAVIGDVMGKGPRAAAVTALARYTVRAAAMLDSDTAGVLRALNHALFEHDGETQVTLAYALLTPHAGGLDVVLASGGHPPPLLKRGDGTVEELMAPGLLLGAVEDPPLQPVTTTLAPGESLLLYTDGVTDIRTANGLLGHEPLAEALATAPPDPAGAVEHLRRATVDAPGHEVRDDVAMLLLRATGPASRSRP
jgi:PAS domain S-box-containing protein